MKPVLVRISVLALALLAACRGDGSVRPALDSFDAASIMANIQVLASDSFEGRGPGTQGERLTVAYLTNQFKKIGLKPGNPDGSYTQRVPLVGFTAKPQASFTAGGKRISLAFPKDYVARSRRVLPEVKVQNSDVVFVGYGVVAPEYGWDDYKGVSVQGKTILMLVNDPAVPDSADPTRLDERMFKGRAMTYYGRWTYKYEIASEKGAAAAIIVHETGPAGYPFDVVASGGTTEAFDIKSADGNVGRVPVEAWITLDRAKELLSAAGQGFDALKRAAQQKGFKPVSLNAKASFDIKSAVREIESENVVARLEGSGPRGKDEYVVYTAHWDHLGRDSTIQGDQIYNGALDNASGTAALLAMARAFTTLSTPPRRSILFLAVTAEEKGLLGSKYYATHPLYPLERTLADINMDGINQWGRTSDMVSIGFGNTTLDDVLTEVAKAANRTVGPDAEPEKGFFYRSDHFEFAKQGVPALSAQRGVQYIGKPEGYGKQKREEYTNNDYHKPSDQIKPDWDLAGAIDDLRLLFQVGYRVAQNPQFPEWKPGTEFKARREAMLKRSSP